MRKLILITACLALMFGLSPAGMATAQTTDMATFRGHTYLVVTTPMTWHQARDYSKQLGGHLVTISDEAENTFVADLARNKGIARDFWIGLTDEAKEVTFVWVTGEPLTYTNWYRGEPSNSGGKENWAAMGWHSKYSWNDSPSGDDSTYPFIVEFETTTATTPTISNEVIAYWNFDEGSGAVARDSSGNGNDGTISGATWIDGTCGKALSFDGNADSVKLPHTIMNNLQDFTFSAWLKVTSGRNMGLFSAANSKYDNEVLIYFRDGKIAPHIRENDFTAGKSIRDGSWHYISVVRKGSSGSIQTFVDGQPDTTKTLSEGKLTVDPNGLWIGREQDSVGGGWDTSQDFLGSVDEVRIYNYPLSQTEIQSDMKKCTLLKSEPTVVATPTTSTDKVTNFIYFNTNKWTDLSPVFTRGTEIYGGTNNRSGGTAYMYLWLSFASASPRIALRACPDAIDPMAGDSNYGDKAKLEVKEVSSSKVMDELSADNIPSEVKAGLKGPYFYRLTITAPDSGYHSSYIFTFNSSPNYAIGKGKVDDMDFNTRVQVGNIGTPSPVEATPMPKPTLIPTTKPTTTTIVKPVMTAANLIAESRAVAPKDKVQVPITLEKAQNIGSMNFILTYDPKVLRVIGVDKGSLLSGAMFAPNYKEPPVIRFGFALKDGISDSGPVAYIEFEAIGSDGSSSALSFSEVTATNTSRQDLSVNTQNGVVTIGKKVFKGDYNGDGQITELDALAALKMSVKLMDEDLILDVNQDSKVTAEDAQLIMQQAISSGATKNTSTGTTGTATGTKTETTTASFSLLKDKALEDELRALIDRFVQGMQKEDVGMMMAPFKQEPNKQGVDLYSFLKEDVSDTFKQFENIKYTANEISFKQRGEQVVSMLSYSLAAREVATSKSFETSGKFLWLWEKDKTGWKVIDTTNLPADYQW